MPDRLNGNKLQITIGATIFVAAITGSFVLGGHLLNDGIHETSTTKASRVEAIVDRRIDREIKPALERIQDQLDEILEHQRKENK